MGPPTPAHPPPGCWRGFTEQSVCELQRCEEVGTKEQGWTGQGAPFASHPSPHPPWPWPFLLLLQAPSSRLTVGNCGQEGGKKRWRGRGSRGREGGRFPLIPLSTIPMETWAQSPRRRPQAESHAPCRSPSLASRPADSAASLHSATRVGETFPRSRPY